MQRAVLPCFHFPQLNAGKLQWCPMVAFLMACLQVLGSIRQQGDKQALDAADVPATCLSCCQVMGIWACGVRHRPCQVLPGGRPCEAWLPVGAAHLLRSQAPGDSIRWLLKAHQQGVSLSVDLGAPVLAQKAPHSLVVHGNGGDQCLHSSQRLSWGRLVQT